MTTDNKAIERLYHRLYVEKTPESASKAKRTKVSEPKQSSAHLQKPVTQHTQELNDLNSNKSNKLNILLWATVTIIMGTLIANLIRINI
ncbi:hypothetical protein MNBD_GAMMA09-3313 [hydrothermal vent metagenome]|uniref:Uncharacterized protein n=1 Tax=hydrothermal vent metagenome TaxID=652676 RepID=A0A3B0XC12_9ZZZZ